MSRLLRLSTTMPQNRAMMTTPIGPVAIMAMATMPTGPVMIMATSPLRETTVTCLRLRRLRTSRDEIDNITGAGTAPRSRANQWA